MTLHPNLQEQLSGNNLVARGLGKLLKLGVFVYVSMTFAMLIWTIVWPTPSTESFKSADAIVCLGGGMSPNGTLAAPVLTRIERCVQLYEAERAPVIVFSGGTAAPNGPNAGSQMALYATSLGLPNAAVVVEERAQSTLQNALFSLAEIPEARRIIVVTEAFHLPRSWASFKWASAQLDIEDLDVSLAMSEKVRRNLNTGNIGWKILIRESFAIWFNFVRAAAYTLYPNSDVSWLH